MSCHPCRVVRARAFGARPCQVPGVLVIVGQNNGTTSVNASLSIPWAYVGGIGGTGGFALALFVHGIIHATIQPEIRAEFSASEPGNWRP